MAFRTKNRGGLSGLTDFLTNNWQLVVGVVLVLPLLINYIQNWFKSQAQKEREEIANNPTKLQEAMDEAYSGFEGDLFGDVTADDIQMAAKGIFEAYNIPKDNWGYLNPGNWFEDDKRAFELHMAVTQGWAGSNYDYLAKCYELVSAGRDYTRDLEKFWDAKYLAQITR